MALIIPKDVGGIADVPIGAQNGQPKQAIAKTAQLIIPSDVGGLAHPSAGEIARGPEGVLTQEPEESRAVRELPELGAGGFDLFDDEDKTKLSKAKLATMFTTNPRELSNILSSISPDIGITQTPEGDLIANNNKTGKKFVINKPGLSVLDIIQGLGTATAFAGGAGVAQIPKQVGARALFGAGAAGLTQTAIEVIQEQLGGELNADEIAIATSLGGAAELVVPAIQAFRQSRQAKRIGAERQEMQEAAGSVQQATEASAALKKETGVDVGLFPAQQTQVPSQLVKQRLLPQLDAGSRAALNGLERQNQEAFDATVRLLDTIAPSENVAGAPLRLKSAAQNALDAQKLIRKESSRFGDVVKQADIEGAGKDIDLIPVKNKIDSLKDEFVQGGELEKTVLRVERFLEPVNDKEFMTFSQLQRAKKEMDGIINAIGEKAVDSSVKGEIRNIKNSLVEQMKKGHEPFRQASETFAKESGAVDAIQNALVGRLSSVTDKQLKNISSEIFNPRTSALEITQAKRLIEKADPLAWRDIVRNEIEFRIGSLTNEITDQGASSVSNLPSILRRGLFGNNKSREVLMRALDKDQKRNFAYLETVLKRAESGRAAGSPTASFGEVIKELRGKLGVLKDVFTKPIQTIQETGDTTLFNRKVKTLTEAMFDPKWKARVSDLRKLGINSPASARAMSQLLKDVGSSQDKELEKAKNEGNNG